MTYELVLRAGRVIDRSLGIDRVADVAFAGGRVVAVGNDLAQQTRSVHDAAGRIVTPGLIDLHTHWWESPRLSELPWLPKLSDPPYPQVIAGMFKQAWPRALEAETGLRAKSRVGVARVSIWSSLCLTAMRTHNSTSVRSAL